MLHQAQTTPETPGAIACGLRTLKLTHFRNYIDQSLDVSSDMLIFTGANGSGKTNLLEAVSFFTPGRGLRRAKLADITNTKTENKNWSLFATLQHGDETVAVGTGPNPETMNGRLVKIDGKNARSQMQLADYIHIIWLTPQMDRLFTDGATDRRHFMDRLILGHAKNHASLINQYNHAMRERNKLLEHPNPDTGWLSQLEEQMADLSVKIAANRLNTLADLQQSANQAISAFPIPDLSVHGTVEKEVQENGLEKTAKKLCQIWAQNRQKDTTAGRTLIGPHRSDFIVSHREKKQPAGFCSTGEQKSLLVSIILANSRLTTENQRIKPILLLDEVLAHLDEVRRRALFEEITALKTQSWITGTDQDLFNPVKKTARFFNVTSANIVPGL